LITALNLINPENTGLRGRKFRKPNAVIPSLNHRMLRGDYLPMRRL
jgi:hypothetical protein